ncbi:hypothetical protein [uncultured Endozoicomonas sp.]|uniref:hypothetical protein n=1 Tax=uncultured Endozoicomonas sp. TaxID=432652 RepID=UPI00260EB43B|nr:hypothetical protein [uncultured Endozoicomonas sp.]
MNLLKLAFVTFVLATSSIVLAESAPWHFDETGFYGDPLLMSPGDTPYYLRSCEGCSASIGLLRNRETLKKEFYITFYGLNPKSGDYVEVKIGDSVVEHKLTHNPGVGLMIDNSDKLFEAMKNMEMIQFGIQNADQNLVLFRIYPDQGRQEILDWFKATS